jgi:excinuclease UvrABC helicase subunit UvrB
MRSGFERTLAAQMKKLRVQFEYEPTKLPFVVERTYCPDFYIPATDIYIEAKGKLDADTKVKMIAVKKAHPELDIRIVFMRGSNKLSKSSSKTYMDWAAQHGFPAADGEIPTEWLK